MWCTRWFLPLLLLPLPTAPPYFLILFLFSLTMHAKPCFYCIVLLTTLFISSCYWQPFPIDSPLTTPWSENITTFAEALNTTLMANYAKPLPTVMRAVDRCWCDFSGGGFFEPFNVSHWEYLSVQRLRQDLERQKILEDTEVQEEMEARSRAEPQSFLIYPDADDESTSNTTFAVPTTSAVATSGFWSRLRQLGPKSSSSTPIVPSQLPIKYASPTVDPHRNLAATPSTRETQPINPPIQVVPDSTTSSPLLRQEYDLRPYGLGMIIDLSWAR
ncbi:hypothetical protein BDZ97DRAFT_395952 [Flammula alnicola]|nr:hypothetical protein BDZ97DRAFT_395952 [Flammula alnicola]